MTRRHALQLLGAMALTPPILGSLARASNQSQRKLILLWLEGGPSQLETFDPKPGTAEGGPGQGLGTDVTGWMFGDHLPGLARRAEHLCVIRSMSTREGNHSRARELVKTGYTPTPTVTFPTLGSMTSHETGQESDLPGFVQINGAPGSSGFFGVEHAPFVMAGPQRKIDNIDYSYDVNATRMDYRTNLLEVLERGFEERGGREVVRSQRSLRRQARRLMDSPLRKAFDLDQERERKRDQYGRHDFGQSCLLARRLLEHGVSAVEIVLGGWDTHDDNFRRTQSLCEQLDPGFSALMDDLNRSGLAEETLVVCMGEFGRTPEIVDGNGRNHWPRNWCVALFGAGVGGGQAIGSTDARGRELTSDPVSIADLYATLAELLGIDRDKTFVVGQRPVTLVDPLGESLGPVIAG